MMFFLSSLIAGLLALDEKTVDAVWKAKHILWNMINNGYTPGGGSDVLNHSSNVVKDLPSSFLSGERFKIWLEVKNCVEKLVTLLPREGIPEVGLNIGYALPEAKTYEDICAVNGRIVKIKNGSIRCGCVDFGVSKHVASIILASMNSNPRFRCAINLRYSKNNLERCRKSGFDIGSFDRKDESEDVKSTMEWGTGEAIGKFGSVPDAIFDDGGVGKEPMIRVLGKNPSDVVKKVEKMLKM